MIFGFGKKNEAAPEDDEEEEIEYVLFQGAVNGKDANLEDNKKLVAAGLTPAKELVTDALAERSDSFRMEPQGERAVVTFSIDGIRRPGPKFPIQRANAITQMLKLLAGLDITVKDKPQVGGIKGTYKDYKWEITVKSAPVKGGEQLTVMYRNLKINRVKPEDIGTPDLVRTTIRDYAAQKKGVILFAGPPESGLTTQTLALLRCVDVYLYQCFILGDMGSREVVNVPIFKADPAHSLDETIERIRRNDGDLIFFTNLNDDERAKVAFKRAGDIAIASEVTAKDAADAIVKMIERVGGDRQLVADGLRCVVSPRLIRKLCNKCKEAFRPSPKLLAQVGLPDDTEKLYRRAPEPEPDPKTQELPPPCPNCNDECYRGRAAIFEMITMSDAIKEVILSGGDADAIRAAAKKDKQLTWQQDALRLVAEGSTGLDELQRIFKPAGPAKKAAVKKAPPKSK